PTSPKRHGAKQLTPAHACTLVHEEPPTIAFVAPTTGNASPTNGIRSRIPPLLVANEKPWITRSHHRSAPQPSTEDRASENAAPTAGAPIDVATTMNIKQVGQLVLQP
ncbi:MAG: hypothetical protein K2Q25_00695, partial [Mycobacteriaceae bacterium]|nr:hypothetical protein [Mycobacteriaceae bacterium]